MINTLVVMPCYNVSATLHETLISVKNQTYQNFTIIKKNNIQSIELLKIDCEGAEYDIIYGSDKIKEKIVKNIVGEFHNLKYTNTKNKSDELLNYCKLYVDGIISISILNFM